jgi:transposase
MYTTPSTITPPLATPLVHIGLDVSKDTLDVCLLITDKRHEKQFANDVTGHRQLVRWAHALAKEGSCHFCLEATGPYSQSVALFLVEKEQKVSVINPARIRFFGLAQNQGNKTDKADARLIAQYCRLQSPPPWRIAAPEVRLLQEMVRLLQEMVRLLQEMVRLLQEMVRLLQEMVRRLHALSELAAQEKNRAQAPGQSKAVLASSKRVVAALNKELLRLRQEVRAHVKAHEALQRDAKLLQTIPGIGEITSWDILAEMPDVQEFDSAQSVAAYAGLAPREQRSGSSVRKATTLSKRGNSRLRKAFYFPAVSAMQWNPLVKAHYERLRDKGKPKMVALAACMRKLLMICYGVLKHQKPFDPAWLS